MDGDVGAALLLSLVIKGLIDYLKIPLVGTKFVRNWMVNHKLAVWNANDYMPSQEAVGITIWWLPYLSLLLGIIGSITFGIDVVEPYFADVAPMARLLLTSIIVGIGSKMINDVTKARVR